MVAQMCFQNFGKELQPGDPRVGHQTQNLWNFWRPRLVAVSGWPCGSSETYFFNCSAETYRNFETPHNWKKMQCLRVLPLILWTILINQYAVSLIFFWCSFQVQWLPQQFHKCTIHPVGGSTKEESDQRVCLILLFSIWGLIAFGVVDSSRHAGWSDYQSQMEPGQNFSICQDSISKYCTSWLADNVDWTLLGFAVLLKLKRRNLLLAYQAPEHAKPKPTVFCYRQAQMLAVPPDHKSAPCIASDSGECWPLPHCGLQGAHANPSWMEVMAL